MAKTIQREIRKRGFFGIVFKYLFIAFNLLMAIWVVSGIMAVGDGFSELTSEAERAGGAIGATLGIGMLLLLWAIGDVILGMLTYFTRGKRMLVTEEVA